MVVAINNSSYGEETKAVAITSPTARYVEMFRFSLKAATTLNPSLSYVLCRLPNSVAWTHPHFLQKGRQCSDSLIFYAKGNGSLPEQILCECKKNALKIQSLRLSDKELRREELENHHPPRADLAPRTSCPQGRRAPAALPGRCVLVHCLESHPGGGIIYNWLHGLCFKIFFQFLLG